MVIKSDERSTGMGAVRYTAVPVKEEDGRWSWERLSRITGAKYLGRDRGVESYSLEVADDSVFANFYRSNSGKQSVTVFKGGNEICHFATFGLANDWLNDGTGS